MKKWKRASAFVLTVFMCIMLSACGGSGKTGAKISSPLKKIESAGQNVTSKISGTLSRFSFISKKNNGEETSVGEVSSENAVVSEDSTGLSDSGNQYATQNESSASAWAKTVSGVSAADSSGLPGLSDDATEENLLRLLYLYDPDGAFFLNYALDTGSDFMVYFDGGDAVSGVSTAVHEECHYFEMTNEAWDTLSVYVGDGYSIVVDETDVYESHEMIGMIPEELQTFRYETYVGEPDDNLASDVDGVYGLLNEFTAYCWGTNDSVVMFDYYMTLEQTPDTWLAYIGDCTSISAYAEFRYYILTYLLYAQENEPDVYEGIMNNTKFLAAFCAIDDKYCAVIEEFSEHLDEIETVMTDAGYVVERDRLYYYIGTELHRQGVGLGWEDYDLLMNFMESDADYLEMYESLRSISE